MRFHLTVLTGIFFLAGCGSRATSVEAPARLPIEWIAPTGSGSERFDFQAAQSLGARPLTAELERNLRSTIAFPLEAVERGAATPPSAHEPWGLRGFIASFGVSVEGEFGLLPFSGEAGLKLVWQRSPEPKAALHEALAEDERSDDVPASDTGVEETSTIRDPQRSLEPAIRAAIATGKVRDGARLRRNLRRIVNAFEEISRALESGGTASGWEAGQLRLEVGVDVSGELMEVAELGVTTTFRFEWDRPRGSSRKTLASESFGPLGKSFHDFAFVLGREIGAAAFSSTHLARSGFKLEGVRVGVGISAEGSIGIAKKGASLVGCVTFSPVPGHHAEARASSKTDSTSVSAIELIRSGVSPAERARAQAQGVSSRSGGDLIGPGAAAGRGSVFYRVEGTSLRQGLRRAFDMAGVLAQSTTRLRYGGWEVSELETEFEVSLKGSLGLATVGGVGEVAIELASSRFEENE